MSDTINKTNNFKRRDLVRKAFILGSFAAATPSTFASQLLNTTANDAKQLRLYNLHTDEKLSICYWEQGQYIDESLDAINTLLRDHRSDEITNMDVQLIDQLHQLSLTLGAKNIEVISGYRSKKTNDALRKQGRQVAKFSYHLTGQAIDVHFTGVTLRNSLRAALKQHPGGVGYYPGADGSGFIHLDTGRKRQWGPI